MTAPDGSTVQIAGSDAWTRRPTALQMAAATLKPADQVTQTEYAESNIANGDTAPPTAKHRLEDENAGGRRSLAASLAAGAIILPTAVAVGAALADFWHAAY